MSFVVYNIVICRLQQCIFSFIMHYVNAALLNSPWMLDVADGYKVLSLEMCCPDWLLSYRSFGGIWCLSRAERWGSIFSDFGAYRRHYTVLWHLPKALHGTLAPTEGTTQYPPQKAALFIIITVTASVLTIRVNAVRICWRVSSCHGCGDQLSACHRCVLGLSQANVCT